jgi:ubiquinone/menaquinone biosynthesis C-methylase UbiE
MKLYNELSSWWQVMSPAAEYREEAAFYCRTLNNAASRPIDTLLELGSGGGNNASFLKARFQMTLVDRSPQMLAVSRTLNPSLPHVEGDMRTVRLERQFDAVFVHDAIMYMATEHDLRQAIQTAFVHCRPGGTALFVPDFIREKFRASTEHGGTDAVDRGLRYLEWCWDEDPHDHTYNVEYVFALREPDGSVHVELDRHVEGLFSRAEWLRLLEDAGFHAQAIVVDHSELPPDQYELFLCQRP